jgi:flagellar biosynthetic protein FliR
MPFPLQSLEQMQVFFWIFIRVSIILFLLPLFGARGVPTTWKIGFSLMIAIILAPLVPSPAHFPETGLEVLLAIGSETVMGLLLAMAARLLLASVQIAGQFMGFQMGFSMASMMDPQTGGQSSVISQFLYTFTILVFFSVNAHHLFITALASSFRLVPPMTFHMAPSLFAVLIKVSSEMFVIALKIAAPIMIALFLSNLCLGIVARTVPQVNILMIGFPLNIGLGMIILSLVVKSLSPFLTALSQRTGVVIIEMLRMM